MRCNWQAASCFLLSLLSACQPGTPAPPEARTATDSPMGAASGVSRADHGAGSRQGKIIPLTPMTGDVELLYGNPETPGEPFVMRIRELPGTKVPPHTHPVDEHITVVQGTWYFGLGTEYRQEDLRELKAGSYAFAPAGTSMFGFSPGAAIVQVHGIGPFRIHWLGELATLDDKGADAVFRFPRGAHVRAGDRAGTIAEGYRSGSVKQYEIETVNGERFMADEASVHLQ